jgi:FlaA1/EpsC-like NDP-sugar epimerase
VALALIERTRLRSTAVHYLTDVRLQMGTGAAGEKILPEIFENYHLHYNVVGFIDDDIKKLGRSIHGVPVRGSVHDLPIIVERGNIEEVLIAVPSASGEQMRRIVDICKSCNIFYKTPLGISETVYGCASKLYSHYLWNPVMGVNH